MKVPLLNFIGGPGIPLLNFEEGLGVPLLNFRGVPGPTFKLWGGSRVPWSWPHFYTMPVHKYINFRSLKNYRVDDYKKSLGQLVFPNYEIFDNGVSAAYSDFFQKIMPIIDKTAPFKAKRVKRNTQK